MHNHFVGIIATAALEEHPSATSYKDFVSKDLKEHILLISLFNGWLRFVEKMSVEWFTLNL